MILMSQFFLNQGWARVMAEVKTSSGVVKQVLSNGSVQLADDRIYEPANERAKDLAKAFSKGQHVTLHFYDEHGGHFFTDIALSSKKKEVVMDKQAVHGVYK